MKPKDFRAPFTFAERRVLLRDQVLCIPANYSDWDSYTFPGWQAIFGNENPVHIEYCSGNGSWIVDRAKRNPNQNWVAVEKRYDRVAKIWSKIQNQGLTNLLCIWGEAETATRVYLPKDSVSTIYINFPDPWPRKRHHKHRLMKVSFVEEMRRILLPGGQLTLVTDDAEYSDFATQELLQSPLNSLHADPYYIRELEGYGTSYFEELWREKGREIRYHQWEKARV